MFDSPRTAFGAGARDITPILVGAIPFGMVVGAVSADVGLSALQAVGMSVIAFAGVSQLVALELFRADAVVWVVVLSAAMVNLRHLIYSASLAPHFKHLSTRWKLLLSYLIVDQTYAFGIAHFAKYPSSPHKRWYYLGVGMPIWVVWMTATVVGFFLGTIIPASWSLNFVIPLMFLSMVVAAIKGIPHGMAVIVTVIVSLSATDLPNNLGLITAILAGIMTGAVLERLRWP